jgi:hypothetical protein
MTLVSMSNSTFRSLDGEDHLRRSGAIVTRRDRATHRKLRIGTRSGNESMRRLPDNDAACAMNEQIGCIPVLRRMELGEPNLPMGLRPFVSPVPLKIQAAV